MTDVRWLDDVEGPAWEAFQLMQAQLSARLGRELAADSGLSMQDYAVLVALTGRADGRARLYRLSTQLGWERSRLSHHLTRMEQRGLVARQACASDRRGAYVSVTAAGHHAISAAAPGHVEAVRRLFVDLLSREQVVVLGQVARTVLAALADGDADGDEPED